MEKLSGFKITNTIWDKFPYWKITLLCRLFGKKTKCISANGRPAISYRWRSYYHIRILKQKEIIKFLQRKL